MSTFKRLLDHVVTSTRQDILDLYEHVKAGDAGAADGVFSRLLARRDIGLMASTLASSHSARSDLVTCADDMLPNISARSMRGVISGLFVGIAGALIFASATETILLLAGVALLALGVLKIAQSLTDAHASLLDYISGKFRDLP